MRAAAKYWTKVKMHMKLSKPTPTQIFSVIQESQADTAVKNATKRLMIITVFLLFLAMALYIETFLRAMSNIGVRPLFGNMVLGELCVCYALYGG
jgi:hypothetical protein